MSSSKDSLVPDHSSILARLYDPEALLSIKPAVINGFIVLLGDAHDKHGNKAKRQADLSLSFLALTEGNILEACHGVVNPSRRENTPASRAARSGKDLLGDIAMENTGFPKIAVEAYCEAFHMALKYDADIQKLNCITRCFRKKNIYKKAVKNLRVPFTRIAVAAGEVR
jgi:hypothetical protein